MQVWNQGFVWKEMILMKFAYLHSEDIKEYVDVGIQIFNWWLCFVGIFFFPLTSWNDCYYSKQHESCEPINSSVVKHCNVCLTDLQCVCIVISRLSQQPSKRGALQDLSRKTLHVYGRNFLIEVQYKHGEMYVDLKERSKDSWQVRFSSFNALYFLQGP